MGEAETHHVFEIGLTLRRHPATEVIHTLQQGFRLRGMPAIGGSLCTVHQIIAIVSDGEHVGKRVNPQTVENYGCREFWMVIPDFAGELPMTVEIAVVAWCAKSAVHVGDPCRVGRNSCLDLLAPVLSEMGARLTSGS